MIDGISESSVKQPHVMAVLNRVTWGMNFSTVQAVDALGLERIFPGAPTRDLGLI